MSQKLAIIAGAAAVGLVGITFAVTMGGGRSVGDCEGSEVGGAEIGGPFELVLPDGTQVTDVDVITEPTIIYFGYTFCPDVCPIDNARNAAAVDILAEQGYSVTPVFISIDPARDTPEVVGDYIENFHPKMIGLTGSDAQVKAASDAYRTFYKIEEGDPEYYLVSHSVFSYFVLPEQGFVDFFRREASPDDIAARVSCFLDA